MTTHLRFGSIEIDTRGLPEPLMVTVSGPHTETGPVYVTVVLEGTTRTPVEQWAERLGVPAVESVSPLYPGDPWPVEVAAVLERDGYQVTACVSLPAAGGVSC